LIFGSSGFRIPALAVLASNKALDDIKTQKLALICFSQDLMILQGNKDVLLHIINEFNILA
jgi:hypothetical protein